MKNLDLLDKVLLSENVFENFKQQMGDVEFASWLSSIVPVIGFTLSTLSLSSIRKAWEKKQQ